jgi:hypothetical protein
MTVLFVPPMTVRFARTKQDGTPLGHSSPGSAGGEL